MAARDCTGCVCFRIMPILSSLESPQCPACAEHVTSLKRKHLAGRHSTPREDELVVAPAKRVRAGGDDDGAVRVAAEHTGLPERLRDFREAACAGDSPSGSFYLAYGYHHDENDEHLAYRDTIVSTGEEMDARTKNILVDLMKLIHSHVVTDDATQSAQLVSNIAELKRAAFADKGCLHRMMHALATCEDLPTSSTATSGMRDSHDVLAPFVMCEVLRKLVNPRYSAPLQKFISSQLDAHANRSKHLKEIFRSFVMGVSDPMLKRAANTDIVDKGSFKDWDAWDLHTIAFDNLGMKKKGTDAGYYQWICIILTTIS